MARAQGAGADGRTRGLAGPRTAVAGSGRKRARRQYWRDRSLETIRFVTGQEPGTAAEEAWGRVAGARTRSRMGCSKVCIKGLHGGIAREPGT